MAYYSSYSVDRSREKRRRNGRITATIMWAVLMALFISGGNALANNAGGVPSCDASNGHSNAPACQQDEGSGGEAPGQSGEAPGQSGEAPGQSGEAPGQSGEAPGQSGEAPGQGGAGGQGGDGSNAGGVPSCDNSNGHSNAPACDEDGGEGGPGGEGGNGSNAGGEPSCDNSDGHSNAPDCRDEDPEGDDCPSGTHFVAANESCVADEVFDACPGELNPGPQEQGTTCKVETIVDACPGDLNPGTQQAGPCVVASDICRAGKTVTVASNAWISGDVDGACPVSTPAEANAAPAEAFADPAVDVDREDPTLAVGANAAPVDGGASAESAAGVAAGGAAAPTEDAELAEGDTLPVTGMSLTSTILAALLSTLFGAFAYGEARRASRRRKATAAI